MPHDGGLCRDRAYDPARPAGIEQRVSARHGWAQQAIRLVVAARQPQFRSAWPVGAGSAGADLGRTATGRFPASGHARYLAVHFRSAQQALGAIEPHAQANAWLAKVRTIAPIQRLLAPVSDAACQRTVYDALMRDRQLRISYRKREHQQVVRYEAVHPLAVVQRGQLIYLVCMFRPTMTCACWPCTVSRRPRCCMSTAARKPVFRSMTILNRAIWACVPVNRFSCKRSFRECRRASV